MPAPEWIKRKIRTAEELQSVVKTMKALAAVNILQYEKAVESLAEYFQAIERGLQIVLKKRPAVFALPRQKSIGRLGAVVFGSDQGMAGQLNERIVEHILHLLQEMGIEPDRRAFLTIGLRVNEALEEAGQGIERNLSVPGSVEGITPMVQELIIILEEWHFVRGIDRIYLFYNQPLSGAQYHPHTVQLLPVDSDWLQELEGRKWPTRVLPTFTMAWDRLFSLLIRQYLFVSLYRAFAESLASENISRLVSMQGAEKNIEERLAELKVQYQRERHTAITEELLDIIAGFEALRGDGRSPE